jgi:hypothetical protein
MTKMDRIALANSISDYEQRCFIKIGVLLNKSAKDIHSLLRKALQVIHILSVVFNVGLLT